MLHKCPGNDTRKLTAEFIKCTSCLADVEIFSDETWRICPNCGEEVSREKMPNCIEWCQAAKECVGEERYNNYMNSKKEEV